MNGTEKIWKIRTLILDMVDGGSKNNKYVGREWERREIFEAIFILNLRIGKGTE